MAQKYKGTKCFTVNDY